MAPLQVQSVAGALAPSIVPDGYFQYMVGDYLAGEEEMFVSIRC